MAQKQKPTRLDPFEVALSDSLERERAAWIDDIIELIKNRPDKEADEFELNIESPTIYKIQLADLIRKKSEEKAHPT